MSNQRARFPPTEQLRMELQEIAGRECFRGRNGLDIEMAAIRIQSARAQVSRKNETARHKKRDAASPGAVGGNEAWEIGQTDRQKTPQYFCASCGCFQRPRFTCR